MKTGDRPRAPGCGFDRVARSMSPSEIKRMREEERLMGIEAEEFQPQAEPASSGLSYEEKQAQAFQKRVDRGEAAGMSLEAGRLVWREGP